jgi:hypothetical protein
MLKRNKSKKGNMKKIRHWNKTNEGERKLIG